MTDNTEQHLTATDGRSAARKALPGLVGLGAIIAALLILNAAEREEAAEQTIKASSVQTTALVATASEKAKATSATPARSTLLKAEVVGVDLSSARVTGLSSKDGKLTVHYDGAHLLWKVSNNKPVAVATGGVQ